MSEISEINMPNVIHVLGVSGISDKNSTGAQVNVRKKSAELPEHQENVHK